MECWYSRVKKLNMGERLLASSNSTTSTGSTKGKAIGPEKFVAALSSIHTKNNTDISK